MKNEVQKYLYTVSKSLAIFQSQSICFPLGLKDIFPNPNAVLSQGLIELQVLKSKVFATRICEATYNSIIRKKLI